jgi:predicted transcriptional regulator
MKVLLSIKPEYSQRIFSGEKKYEFRRRRPKSTVDMVIVYESSPIRNIVGGFTVKRIHSGSPEAIWEKCKDSSGIAKEDYLDYCSGLSVIYAYEVEEIFKLKQPMNPFKVMADFKPPQSFRYLEGSVINEFFENGSLTTNPESIFEDPEPSKSKQLSFFP